MNLFFLTNFLAIRIYSFQFHFHLRESSFFCICFEVFKIARSLALNCVIISNNIGIGQNIFFTFKFDTPLMALYTTIGYSCLTSVPKNQTTQDEKIWEKFFFQELYYWLLMIPLCSVDVWYIFLIVSSFISIISRQTVELIGKE